MRSVQIPGFSNRRNADASQSISVEGVVLAAYLVATQTPGMRVTEIRRQMGCSYKTAWFLLQRLRRGMVNASRSRLRGRREADEVFIGLPRPGKRGRGVARL